MFQVLCMFSCGLSLTDISISASTSSVVTLCVCVSHAFMLKRVREKGMPKIKYVCTCACMINLINFTAAVSHSHFYGRVGQPPTSETKGNVESCSKDR